MHSVENRLYFHLKSHVYACFFKKEIILLDTQKDEYRILPPELSLCLSKILKSPFNKYLGIYDSLETIPFHQKDLNKAISYLRQEGILAQKDFLYPWYEDLSPTHVKGAFSVDWRIDPKYLHIKSTLPVALRAFKILTEVDLVLRRKGLVGLINIIKEHTKSKLHKDSDLEEQDKYISALNIACLWYPMPVKCLKWLATLSLMLLRHQIPAQFVIGVQNNPFWAHAYVQLNGKVLGDLDILSQQLATILKIP
jgi:hypothetical protein